MATTKADIVEAIYQKIGFSKKEAADLVELVFDSIKTTLSRGEKIKISGFGNFVVREKRARTGRNPQTGDAIEISARRVLTFKPSQVLRSEVNSTLTSGQASSGSGGSAGEDLATPHAESASDKDEL